MKINAIKFRNILKENKISQNKFALISGLTPQTVSNIMRGSTIRHTTANLITEALEEISPNLNTDLLFK